MDLIVPKKEIRSGLRLIPEVRPGTVGLLSHQGA